MNKGRSLFNQVQLLKPKRAKFDLTHERKMSIPFGALIPTMVSEVLPGDSFRVDQSILARFQAMLAPPMHRINVYTHFFYVPNRILSAEWQRFITYQGNRPNFSTAVSTSPYFNLDEVRTADIFGVGNGLKDGSLLDYLGFPTAPNDATLATSAPWYNTLRIAAFLPLAYQRIWNDFYRDQNYTQPMFSDGTGQTTDDAQMFERTTQFTTSGFIDPETTSNLLTSTKLIQLLKLRWRSWEKDYLTSALPYANQGIGDPRVPITVPAGALGVNPAVGATEPSSAQTFGRTGGNISYPGNQVGGATDLGGFTISALRVASALKRWLENTARGGSRYAEGLWHHWFVKSDDARLQMAEYLGGGIQPLVISEVVTTAPATPTQTGVPAGYLAGHGIAYGKSNRFTKRFKEHGVVMAITSVLPRTGYLYSLPRAFMRSEPLDYAFPEFAQIGEQPVLGAEVMFKLNTSLASVSAPNYTTTAMTQQYAGVVTRSPMGYQGGTYNGFDLQNDNPEGTVAGNVWGFQSRYAEYKYIPDTVHGLFRNNQSFWHFGRMLSPNAALNQAFVQSNPRMDSFAILPSNGGAAGQYNQHPILLNVMNHVSVLRSLPYFNTPALW